ncbi:MAG TPA: asparagine synthase (glutamine-hydrolyzing) [Clostridia bacterium]|nr:asparagine synthase (glutamine-hydrolyzing) [Clostridia bacterium]
MCGIAGFVSEYCSDKTLERMGDAISHRGPNETGYLYRDNVGLASKRLSIVDISNGKQPAYNENENIAVIFNGEIFNYVQLRKELEAGGHRISNNSDTAILPHMYEEYGTGMFERLSGQFAIAIYDAGSGKLVLARDRMGIIPLHFYHKNGEFIFGSEIKAILAAGRVRRELSFEGIFDVFTFWSPQDDRTVFKDIYSILPGEYLEFHGRTTRRDRYFRLKFCNPGEKQGSSTECHKLSHDAHGHENAAEDIETLLIKSIGRRLTGDVKICTYLSGGLDSSLITSILASTYDSSVEAFSIGFEDKFFDESKYQRMVCERFGIKQNVVLYRNSEFSELIKKVVWHTETPLLRAGPLPLYRLSELVNKNDIKVVMSGEGSDELFGGYDIFREVKIRNYIRKYPDSVFRKQLFRKVNQFSVSRLQSAPAASLSYFYMHDNDNALFDSHYTRWRQFEFFERFFSDSLRTLKNSSQYPDYHELLGLGSAEGIMNWTDIQRSQYLEIETFLSRYLLSSQGDRVSMANSVEVRFPFLDDDLVDYCMHLDDRLKIRALNEKYILKKIAEKYLPGELVNRKKFPYRSSLDVREIMRDPYLNHILSEEGIARYNLFNAAKIKGFVNSILMKDSLNERETMLLMGVMTLQILCDLFGIQTEA